MTHTASIPASSLSNLQLELLKLYSFDISAEELLDVMRLLGQHFADRLSAQATRAFRERGWTDGNSGTMVD